MGVSWSISVDGSLASTGWCGGPQAGCAQGLPEVSGRRGLVSQPSLPPSVCPSVPELCVWGGAWVGRQAARGGEGESSGPTLQVEWAHLFLSQSSLLEEDSSGAGAAPSRKPALPSPLLLLPSFPAPGRRDFPLGVENTFMLLQEHVPPPPGPQLCLLQLSMSRGRFVTCLRSAPGKAVTVVQIRVTVARVDNE